MKQIIVVGASAASMAFMSKLRSFDQQSKIICFSAESVMPYNRCFLADFLTCDLSLQQLFLKRETFFKDSKIDLKLNHKVIQFDFKSKKVLVDHQNLQIWYDYDYLFLGMGTRPHIPKFLQNKSCSGIFTFHTLQDMQNIDYFINQENPKHAVVIGAGLNGIEAASSLRQKGLLVTVVEGSSQILPGQLDTQAAAWVAQKMLNSGVTLITGHKVVALDVLQHQLRAVILENNQKNKTEMLIVAAGSLPNLDLLQDSELELVNGLLGVDRCLKTNFESVLAAGDLCLVPDLKTGRLVRSTTWSDAMLQGLCAATSLSSNPKSYLGAVGLRDSYFFGKDFYACGQTTDFDEKVDKRVVIKDEKIEKLYIKNGQLLGFLLIGDISRLSELKQWYMQR